MKKVPFHKYHALGNDYLVIDPRDGVGSLELSPENIQRICHRNYGIGSDGILFGPITHSTGTDASRKSPFLRIYNPDGSEAEKSGNGIRIFSRYLKDSGYVQGSFTLHTLGGEVKVEFLDSPDSSAHSSAHSMIRVDMGRVTFDSQEIPVTGPKREVIQEPLKVGDKTFLVTCVSIGNPHCVIPLDQISEKLAREIGPAVENHPGFPKRINMQLLKVLNRKNIQIEIWERGAGYTLASGSSSCAAASVAFKLGLIDPSVTVHMPGGTLQIDQTEAGHVYMTGPVTRVAQGELDPEMFL